MIYHSISSNHCKTAILIDPDNYSEVWFNKIIEQLPNCLIDYFLIGGSTLMSNNIDWCIENIKSKTDLPIILFPGSPLQFSNSVDAMLYLSLISGRNPDFLIGHHVTSAAIIKKMGIETIPTGYILINDGKTTAVEYVSGTKAIPCDKTEIVVSTAIAGELLGMKAIYLEAGSGADCSIKSKIIKAVKKNISIPLIVGGGINSSKQIEIIKASGANLIVIGTEIEQNPESLSKLLSTIKTVISA